MGRNNFINDWNCSECNEIQSKHNSYYDGKCEKCNFYLKDQVESILISHWCKGGKTEPNNYEDIVQEVYEYILSLDKPTLEEDDVIKGLKNYEMQEIINLVDLISLDKKKKEIEIILMDFFSQIGMDRPSNFDDILDFVFNDVNETADKKNWHDGDVAIAFRRWIEDQNPSNYICKC